MDDKSACAELIQSWGLYRDQGKWPELTATFAPEGEIAVSWFSGPFREFVARCRASFEAGVRSKHLILPSHVRLAGERALAETNIVILVRQRIGTVLADLTSYARFLDRLERRGGRWMILERTAIYERDRLDPVEPSRISPSCSRPRILRSPGRPIATWLRARSPPAARWRRWSIAMAPRIPRSSMHGMKGGCARRLGRACETQRFRAGCAMLGLVKNSTQPTATASWHHASTLVTSGTFHASYPYSQSGLVALRIHVLALDPACTADARSLRVAS
jgi:hypothetical protein